MSWFFIGLFVGYVVGMFLFAAGQVNSEKKAVESRVVKLDGKFYCITPIFFNEKMVKKEEE